MYRKRNIPAEVDPTGFFDEEFSRVEAGCKEPSMDVMLSKSHKEPNKLRDGMLVYADGTDWDPGSGAGLYHYRASGWVFIG